MTLDVGPCARAAITAFVCQGSLFVLTGAPRSRTSLADSFPRNRVGVEPLLSTGTATGGGGAPTRITPLRLRSENEERGPAIWARAGDVNRFGAGARIFGLVGVDDCGVLACTVPSFGTGGLYLIR